MLYFGKTTLPHDDMLEYLGSGNRWLNHINKHGVDKVETLWYCLFYDKNDCENFALSFSKNQMIVESNNWANLIPENGLSGFPAGLKFKDSHKKSLSSAKKGKTWEEIYGEEGAKLRRLQNSQPRGSLTEKRKQNISNAKKGMASPHEWSIELREKVSEKLSGIKRSEETKQKMRESSKTKKICPYCGLEGSGPSMQRWHFNNCKSK